MAAGFTHLRIDKNGDGIAEVVLNRPNKLNTMTLGLSPHHHLLNNLSSPCIACNNTAPQQCYNLNFK
jgi:hypothetical protein